VSTRAAPVEGSPQSGPHWSAFRAAPAREHADRHRHVPELTCDFNSSIDLCIASYLVVKKAWLCADADELRLSETTLGSSAVKVLVNFITATENVVSELTRDLVN